MRLAGVSPSIGSEKPRRLEGERPREPWPALVSRCFNWLSALCVFLMAAAGSPAAEEMAWQEVKGQHVIVRYQASKSFAEQVQRRAEVEYDRIARDLGITRHGNFWLWDKRARIDIHGTREAYLAATQAPAWSAGRADYRRRVIETFANSPGFLESVLPHEMTHLIFREFIGFGADVPLWLDEGVAQWADVPNRSKVESMARALLAQGRLLSVAELTQVDPRRGATGREAVDFYAQSASLVGFLKEKQGRVRFREFCGHIRDGSTVDDALRFTYPNTTRNVEALDSAWRTHLEVAPDEQTSGRIYTH